VIAILFSSLITLSKSRSMNHMIRNRTEETNIQRFPTVYLSTISEIFGGILGATGVKGIIFSISMILIFGSGRPS
jgi:hypothetical protein